MQAEACAYRIAFGPRAGHKLLTGQGALTYETDFKQTLFGDMRASVCTPLSAAALL